jgi:HlyD family secretion protein
MYARFLSLQKYILAHKIITAVVVVVLVGGGWWLWGRAHTASAATRYVVGTVERGTVVSSISASGQISASSQVDLKPKASGDVTYVGVKAGQEVKAGQLLVSLDSGDAGYELQSAELSYQKLVTVDPTELRDAQSAVSQAQDDEASSYISARSTLTKASADMTNVMDSLGNLFDPQAYLSTQDISFNDTEKEYRDRAHNAWYDASDALKAFSASFSALPPGPTEAQIDAQLAQGYSAASLVALAAKDAQDAVAYIRAHKDPSTEADSAYSSVVSLASTANGSVSSLSSAQSSTSNNKRALDKAQGALEDLQAGPNELDRRSQELSVRQKQEALADYSVYAPFDGVVAQVDAKVGDQGSSGTAVATLITKSQIAKISLNEVDAAKIKAGQKATLTFDAIDDLTLTGTVAEVDAIGTVSQGVVSYDVQIALDAQDSRIKPGMTVNAQIQTDTAQDVLVVPASAVKTSAGQSYVLAFESPVATSSATASGITSSQAPVQIPVEVGIADDTNVEITSGLTEGEQIITRTITASAASTAAATTRASGTTGARAGGFGGAAPAGAALRAL